MNALDGARLEPIVKSQDVTSFSQTDAIECDLGLGAIDRTATATFLSGDSPDAFNDIATPDRVVPVNRDITIRGGRVTIPAHTLLIVSLDR